MLTSASTVGRLSSLVESLWDFADGEHSVPQRAEHVLPDTRFQIIFDLESGCVVVCGVRSRHVVIDPSRMSRMAGVLLRPGRARAVLGTSATEFLDRAVAADLVFGPCVRRVGERLQEAATAPCRLKVLEDFMGSLDGVTRPSGAVIDFALSRLAAQPDVGTVAELSREIGWSRRWLTQTFAREVGLTPKRYCRLVRFQQVVRDIRVGGHVNWAEVAQACGFFDQAHLCHEFLAFSGLTPEQYLKALKPYPNHAIAA